MKNKSDILPAPCDDLTFRHINLLGQLYSLVWGTAGVWFGPGTRPVPIDPEWRLWENLSSDKRDIILGLAATEIAATMQDRQSREDVERAGFAAIRSALDRAAEKNNS